MKTPRVYSDLFSCVYDEAQPVGKLGRGTHYSILRCSEWLDVYGRHLPTPQVHDFAVLWDEDHDTRVIRSIEEIYMAGLLFPVTFIGERKGTLTLLVDYKFFYGASSGLEEYSKRIFQIAQCAAHNDCWAAEVGTVGDVAGSRFVAKLHQIVHAEDNRVQTYLRNIDSLWTLGTKPFEPEEAIKKWEDGEASAELNA